MDQQNQIDPRAALGEVRRVERDVHSRSRWQGWIWLLLAAITPAFLIGTVALEGDSSLLVAIGFMAVALLAWFWESRQRVIGRTGARLDQPVTTAFVAAMVIVTVLRVFVLPDEVTIGLVLSSLLPAIPCLVGAWLVLRQ